MGVRPNWGLGAGRAMSSLGQMMYQDDAMKRREQQRMAERDEQRAWQLEQTEANRIADQEIWEQRRDITDPLIGRTSHWTPDQWNAISTDRAPIGPEGFQPIETGLGDMMMRSSVEARQRPSVVQPRNIDPLSDEGIAAAIEKYAATTGSAPRNIDPLSEEGVVAAVDKYGLTVGAKPRNIDPLSSEGVDARVGYWDRTRGAMPGPRDPVADYKAKWDYALANPKPTKDSAGEDRIKPADLAVFMGARYGEPQRRQKDKFNAKSMLPWVKEPLVSTAKVGERLKGGQFSRMAEMPDGMYGALEEAYLNAGYEGMTEAGAAAIDERVAAPYFSDLIDKITEDGVIDEKETERMQTWGDSITWGTAKKELEKYEGRLADSEQTAQQFESLFDMITGTRTAPQAGDAELMQQILDELK